MVTCVIIKIMTWKILKIYILELFKFWRISYHYNYFKYSKFAPESDRARIGH